MKSRVIHFLMILICFLLQTTLVEKIAIGSICPNLLLVFCVAMGLMRGRKSGMWTGFFCGLLVDLFYGAFFGFYALIYMYIGFFCGYAHTIFYDDDLKVPVFLSGAADIAYNLAVYGLQFLLRGRLGIRTYLLRIILPELFYTMLLAFVVYRVFYYVNYHFMAPVRRERDSIWVIK